MAALPTAVRPVEAAQLDAIKSVSAAVAHGVALDDTLRQIARTAAELVSAQAAAIILREGEAPGLAIAGAYGLGARYAEHINATRPLEIGTGPSGIAAETGRPVCVADVLVDELVGPWRQLAVHEHYRAMMCVPLRLEDARVIGVLNTYRADPGPWSARDVGLASLLADHAAIAIRTADLLDSSRRQVNGLSLMVRSLRAQAHEHANRMHAIYGLLVLGEVDDARRLVAAVEEGYHSVYGTVVSRIQNATVAGLLIAESAIALQSGIEIVLDRRSRLDELPAPLGDLDAVTILGNLLHNAVEAVSSVPASRRRVRVTVRQRDGETIFRVRDWGPGIPAERLEDALRRDYTTKAGHVGLGLHLVHSVVSRTGGTLAFERMRPTGLQVTVIYQSTRMGLRETTTNPGQVVDRDPPWRVLVVEDDHAVALLHQRLVEAMPGFRSLGVVSDGGAAYRAINSLRPDLAIVDLAMPGGGGRALLRRVRGDGVPVEVIVVTASRDAKSVREMLHLGVVDYLVKPFAPERLQHAMSSFARRARGLRRAQLAQDDVDIVQATGAVGIHRPPKGLKVRRLAEIRSLLHETQEALSAEELGARVGIARVTARRYLEYLDVIGAVTVERQCQGPGRPLNRYRLSRGVDARDGRMGLRSA